LIDAITQLINVTEQKKIKKKMKRDCKGSKKVGDKQKHKEDNIVLPNTMKEDGQNKKGKK
jgi:hypothetical protein